MKKHHFLHHRLLAAVLALVCVLGLVPPPAFAATPSTMKMEDCAYNGTKYVSPTLGECYMHQMRFDFHGSTMGFCAEKGKGMGRSLIGHTWGSPKSISDPTVKMMMAYYYAHSTGVFTDQAKALGVDTVWSSQYSWDMNAWVQAIVWRYKANSLTDPVIACAEELMYVYNNLHHTSYTSIDDIQDGTSFRGRTQYIFDLGAQGVWGDCEVYEYAYAGPGTSSHPKEKHAMRYIFYRGLAQVSNWVRLKFAAMNLKKLASWNARKRFSTSLSTTSVILYPSITLWHVWLNSRQAVFRQADAVCGLSISFLSINFRIRLTILGVLCYTF